MQLKIDEQNLVKTNRQFLKYLKLMRVHHYVKNILIFLPLVFSKNLFNIHLFQHAIIGFGSFSLLSSVVYIINDIQDVEKDREHFEKCNRPIASGAVSVKSGYILALIILVIGIILNYFACELNIISWSFVSVYILINLIYSIKLKNIPIIDIAILASGFLLRLLYGSAITNIEVSKWLYLTVMGMSFYLGLGKRRNELKMQGDHTRRVLKYYNYNFLDKNMYMYLGLTITFYSLWCVDSSTIMKHSNGNIIWTVPLVMLICMKYSLNIEADSDGDPISVLLRDKLLIVMVLIYTLVTLFIIYF